jgi:dihydroflavonol-4-reductase
MERKQTFVVTGASGFVGRWILVRLLECGGRNVVGTFRPGESVEDLPDALESRLSSAVLPQLQLVPADLHSNDDWSTVMAGAISLIHTAAAVPSVEPKDREGFITREVAGVDRVLRAASAAGVSRVVMTSSMAAVVENAQRGDGPVLFGSNDWTDLNVKNLPAYTLAKTRAEQKAWALANELGLSMTTFCPGMVFGPMLSGEIGASMGFLDAIARGTIPKVPPSGFEIVDVRDVAEAHIAALDDNDLAGQRILLAAGYRSMKEIAEVVQREWPEREIPTDEMPHWLVHIFARFIPEMRTVERNLGVQRKMDGRLGEGLLKGGYRSPEESIIAGARSILELSDLITSVQPFDKSEV